MRYLVVGAGGHGQEVAWSLAEHERGRGAAYELLFFDDAVPAGPLASGLGSVVGPLDAVANHADRRTTRLVLGVGLPGLKIQLTERLASTGLTPLVGRETELQLLETTWRGSSTAVGRLS